MLKNTIGWTIDDIKGINTSFCEHKIRLDEGKRHVVDTQPRLNPTMKEVVKKELLKWLDAGIVCAISDITSWKVCSNYQKLNDANFLLPFINQMFDRLARKDYYCFLDGYSGYNQIAIHPDN
ncbi:Transposon Ty3-I Gag-Pol polyprotein [Gossypium australe]|uniref:Transposon Ty3-I Gag-Pol polyprotein n=1 Tax=Gossypium australe TaxID=47621 RepID=A0A5B6VBP3_9ROSI|nr:Transposon Ty3-I Gag-Pol polyprotein [Gossypium australe]